MRISRLAPNQGNPIRIAALMAIVCLLFAAPSHAKIDPADAAGIWNFDNGDAKDSSGEKLNGNFVGAPKGEPGIVGNALRFNGTKDGIKLPDSPKINVTNIFTNRTVVAFFNCDNVAIKDRKQTIFEEGGRTRGLVIYVFDKQVYVAGWNRAEYNWPGAWPSADVESKTWYHVALVIRDAAGKVEDDKFEMWLNGELVTKEKGGQLHPHGDDSGIGHVNQNTVFHDEDGSGTDIHHFEGLLDEVAVYGSALDAADFADLAGPLSVEAAGKFAVSWGAIKSARIGR